jgi:hypothetical protein
MNYIKALSFITTIVILFSCSERKTRDLTQEITLEEKLERLSDSIKVQGITIKNLFKNQILAHKGNEFDSLMIINSVYKPHQKLWDECYAMIFGEENAYKFNTMAGMVEWNKTLYPENKLLFDEKANLLASMNLDSIVEHNLAKFISLVPYEVNATISILFTPLIGIYFGGCNQDQFALELNFEDDDPAYMVEKGLPHELNHLAYEPLRVNDPHGDSPLRQVIDEGFACYFTWVFFDGEISKNEAVENMTEKEWAWFIDHEKQIFQAVEQYFYDETGDNPLLRNDKFLLFEDAPKSLSYWLGFRIIEKYVEKHGKDSWKDIYELDIKDVFEKSGYKQHVQSL